MINSVRSHIDNYYHKLPNNIPEAAITSAIFSFAITGLFTGRLDAGKTAAVLAATVSVISALTMPLFGRFLTNRTRNQGEFAFGVILFANLGITQVLINSWTAYRVNLMSSSLLTILFSVVYTHYYGHTGNGSQTVLLCPPI